MNSKPELDDELHSQISALCEAGDALAEKGRLDAAIEKYQAAFELVSEPFSEWEASTWILATLGDTYYLKREYVQALDALQRAMHCPGAIGNPFLHLRLGQVQFELADEARAADELTRAYMGGGEEIFEGADPKYLTWLKSILRPPRSQ
jgi:tetratricopeptide (TPR) repeat protein